MISWFQIDKILQALLPRKSSYSVDTRYCHFKQFSTGEVLCDTDKLKHTAH